MYQLILGGARSGKSRLAEKLAAQSGLAVIYIATSQPLDGEMNERVALHRQRRPDHWGLVEEPIDLARVLRENAATDRCLLVDCLTLWLTNLLMLEDPARLASERDHLLQTLASLPGETQRYYSLIGSQVPTCSGLAKRLPVLSRTFDPVTFCLFVSAK